MLPIETVAMLRAAAEAAANHCPPSAATGAADRIARMRAPDVVELIIKDKKTNDRLHALALARRLKYAFDVEK